MKNQFFNRFKNVIKLNIKGKNIERFIRRLISHNIEILDMSYPNRNEVNIKVYAKEYEKITELKSIYEVSLLDTYGMIKIKKVINMNRVLFLFIVVGICFLYFLSHIIFTIEIVHTDKDLRTLLQKELEQHGIKEGSFKKNFHELETIKNDIIERHKDTIEWLEIENVGTKYIIRVEERKLPDTNTESGNQNVIAEKSAIIKEVHATSGEIIRNVNDYVSAGDVVISGEIKLNDEVKSYTRAEGTVYGEVWYRSTIEFPYVYHERKINGKTKDVYTIRFLNFRFELFNFSPYKNKNIEEKVIWKHRFLPFSLVKETQQEVEVVENIYTEEQAIAAAEELGIEKMKSKLGDKERILDSKNLKVEIKESKIEVDMFFTVFEDITAYQKIEEPLKEEQDEEGE